MFSGDFQIGMTQGFGGGASTQPDQDAAKKARPDEKQQVLPVTLRSIENAVANCKDKSADSLKFFNGAGCEPSMLILVGAVERLSKQATSMELTLNDGTARMKARFFLTEGTEDLAKQISEGMYVNAVGSVRMSPEVHLGLIALRPVHSANEVSYHTIECAHAALSVRKGPSPIQPMPATSVQPAMTQQPSQPPAAVNTVAPVATTSPAAPADGAALQAAVLEAVKSHAEAAGEVGVSLASVVAAMASGPMKAPEQDIRKTLATLVDSADLYNSIDDEHFLPI